MSKYSTQEISPRSSINSIDMTGASRDFAEEDCQGLLNGKPKRRLKANNARFKLAYVIPWLLSTFLAACLFALVVKSSTTYDRCRQPEFWRQKEFGPATKEIPASLTLVHFDSTLRYNSSGQVYRPVTDPPFVGAPSPAIDAAWEGLLGAEAIFVTPEEQKHLGRDLYLDPETGLYMADISVFHDLHCVNFIRRSMNLEYYTELADNPTVKEHVEHCLDGIRLSLMCAGDMTMIPFEWSDNRGWIMPIFDTDHTCRDYHELRRWSIERDAADPKRYPQNAARINAERERTSRKP